MWFVRLLKQKSYPAFTPSKDARYGFFKTKLSKQGRPAKFHYRLVRPYPNYYNYWNTQVHGMSFQDTAHAAPFPEVWREIIPLIEGLPLVAHNRPFDEGCLKAAFQAYGMEYPGYSFHCTLRASRLAFGRDLPNHQLQTVALRCGYDLTQHHHALADAEACARIALKIL